MALTNTLKKQVDLPVFEWMRFAPVVSSGLSSTCHAKCSVSHVEFRRYIYYMISSTSFWRYDTWTDSYQQLSSPAVTLVTYSSMALADRHGVEGLVISATASTLEIPAYCAGTYTGYDVEIVSGTGAGQRRTITAVSNPIIYDSGIPASISNTLGTMTITDTTKAWAFNQFVGYQVRIISGTGVGQVRRIISNTATVLTLGDSLVKQYEPWAIPGIYSPVPVTTSSVYQIETSTATVDTAWAVTPTATSVFRICSGAIYLITNSSGTYGMQQYDILTDTWYIRTITSSSFPTNPTDGAVKHTGDSYTIWEKGTATAGSTTTLTDSSKNWTVNQFVGEYVRIFSGTGEDQVRLIASNTATVLTWVTVGTAPTTSSQYFIEGFDGGTATAGTVSSLTDSTKTWTTDRWKNYGLRITGGTNKGKTLSIISNTATVLTTTPPLAAALDATSTYSIVGEDASLYIGLGANTGFILHNVDDDIAALDHKLDSGAARQGYVQHGERRPIAVTSIVGGGVTATVTTAISHNLKTGQVVTVGGAITNTGLNQAGATITVTSATVFTYANATVGTATFTGHSTTTLTDSAKNWTVNQWAGYMVTMTTGNLTAANGATSAQCVQIASNTATTLTFVLGTAPTNGVSRYIITRRHTPGAMFTGIATGAQSTSTLTDTNATATFTAYISGNTLTVTAVATGYLGIGSLLNTTGGVATGTTITDMGANTYGGVGTYTVSITQTVGSVGVPVGMATTGWATNIFAGRRVKFIGGTGQGQEAIIASNTATVLTYAVQVTAPVTLITSYAILQQTARGTGFDMIWNFGTTDIANQGKKIIIPRGGAVAGFDSLDIGSGRFEQLANSPQTETLTLGSMYTYDRVDRLYFTKDATQRLYYFDLVNNRIHPAGIYPYIAGAAHIGNRMEIIVTEDNLKYLWLNRHSNAECYRQLLFY